MSEHGEEVKTLIEQMDSGLKLMKEIGKPEDLQEIIKFMKEVIVHFESLKKLYGGNNV